MAWNFLQRKALPKGSPGFSISPSVAPPASPVRPAGVGVGELSTLSWKAWAIEDSALGTILAGLRFDLLQMPTEVRERVRVIRVEKE